MQRRTRLRQAGRFHLSDPLTKPVGLSALAAALPGCSRIMWVLPDVVGLLSTNVGSFSRNVGPRSRIFSVNLVPHRPMLSVPSGYVFGPLHLAAAVVLNV